jgi:hypothetical protein
MSAPTVFSDRFYQQMETVDAMPSALRGCVHEFGLPIVQACLDAGIKAPGRIRQLVHIIWEGARSSHQRRPEAADTLDWLLMQSEGRLSSATLLQLLARQNLQILPHHPTARMIDASLATVADHTIRCTKREKHQLRLIAALAAERDYFGRVPGRVS